MALTIFSPFITSLTRASCVLGLCASLIPYAYSAEGAEDNDKLTDPLVELAIPDVDRLKQRLADSIYAQLWNDPAFELYRQEFTKEKNKEFAKALAKDGIDLQLLIDNFESAGFRLISIDSDNPELSDFRGFVSFKDKGAEEIMTLPDLDEELPTDVDGADQAFISQDGNFTLARFGKTLVFADSSSVSLPAMVTGVESDIELYISLKALGNAWIDLVYKMAPFPPQIEKAKAKELINEYDQFNYSVTVKEKGIFEEINYLGPKHSGLQAVDRNVLNKLPANAIAASAIGINGHDIWEYHTKRLIEIAADANPGQNSEEMITGINNMLSMFGVDIGIQEIITGLHGTAFFCITPSVPYPAVSFGIPRSKDFDLFVSSILMSRLNIIAPAEGQIESIPIQPMIPPIQLALSKTHWFISTDRGLTNQWLKDQSSGWSQSESGAAVLAQAGDNAFVIGAVDVKQITSIAQGLMGLVAMGAKGDDIKHVQAALKLLQQLNQMAEPSWFWGGQKENDYKFEAYSLLGTLPLIALPAAIAADRKKKQKARRAQRRMLRQQKAEEVRLEEADKEEPDSIDDL